jgi:hypothetical protein
MRRNASFPVLSHTTKVFFAIYTKDLTDSSSLGSSILPSKTSSHTIYTHFKAPHSWHIYGFRDSGLALLSALSISVLR